MKFGMSIFKTFFVSLCIIANTAFAYAQTASILPPAKTTFVDQNGKPLTSGTVDFYVPGTTTRKTTWQDSSETIANTNPVVLDAAGRAIILGEGSYRQVVKDRNGNLIWDQVTSSIGSGGSSGSTIGDGLSVGTIVPTTAIIAPANYQFAYGQALSRATYPELLAAVTIQTSIGCVGGSPLINVSDTASISVGTVLESICVAGSPTVVSKTSSTVTLSSNSTITATTTGRFFPYGNGDALTTFNVADMRGYVAAGRCNMGGVDCSVLNSTYFSSNSSNTPSSLNAKGGTQNKTIFTSNLPPYTPNISLGTITGNFQFNRISTGNTGGSQDIVTNILSSGGGALVNVNIGQPTLTIAPQGGTQTPFSLIPPTLTLNYAIKVTPDTNLSSSYGVAAIGGMTGLILCGSNVTCSGNTISFNWSGVNTIQGMSGNISCGVGLTCSAGTISATTSTPQVISSRTVAQTLDLSTYSVVSTLGYASAGDGGGAVFSKLAPGSIFKDTWIATGNIVGGSGYTNGTYLGVPMGGGVGANCQAKVTVSGGAVSAVDLSGSFCNGYGVGNVLVPLTSAIGGTGSGATFTVATINNATGSFSDAAGNLWQYTVDIGSFPNARQFGMKGDWNGNDATATNDLTSFKSAMAFMSTAYGAAGAYVNGGTIIFPKGAYYFCASPAQFATLQVPNGVMIEGAGELGGTTFKQCTASDTAEHFVSLCDPNSQYGQFGCRLEKIALVMTGNSNSGTAAVYSNSGQQFPLLDKVYIQPFTRGCVYYEIGKGGASNAIFNNVDCEQSDTAINSGFFGNSSGTQIVLENWVFGCAPGTCGAGSYAINMANGNHIISNFHIEQHQNGINVATTGTSTLSSIKNGTIVSGCVNGITLQSTNPNNTVLIENIESSCSTATVLNGHAAGSNVTGHILAQRVFNP